MYFKLHNLNYFISDEKSYYVYIKKIYLALTLKHKNLRVNYIKFSYYLC